MITPQPESDLSLNIIVLGAEIISLLKKSGDYIIVEELLKIFLKNDKRRSPDLFFNTLTFLYSLGILQEVNYKVRMLDANT